MKNFFKGFIIGIGKIIPGVSGAMLAISMGIYDKALYYICNFRKNKKEGIVFLFPICLGIILSIIVFSKIISLALAKFYVITMLFFIGLIIGGVPSVVGKVCKKDYIITFISFSFFFLISVINVDNAYVIKNNIIDLIVFFASGILESVGTVVPGVSGTALLMIMGTYSFVINSIGDMNNFRILIPFGIGLALGLVMITKVINYLFNRYCDKVYACILGILLSSIILLMIQIFNNGTTLIQLSIGLVFMIVGIWISGIIDEKK